MTCELRMATNDADDDCGIATPVPSPCVSVCAMDASSGLCTGCLRTIDEIAGWSSFSDDERRAIWRRISERRKG